MKTAKTRHPRRSSQPKGIQFFKLQDIFGDVDNHTVDLQIDDSLHILEKLATSRWKSNPINLKTFVRRTLEVAIRQAMTAEQEFKAEIIADWRKAGILSKAAAKSTKQASISLKKLIGYLSGIQNDPDLSEDSQKAFSVVDVLSRPISHMLARDARTAGKPISPQSAAEIGKKDAVCISNALDALIWFEAHCKHMSREVAKTYRNPGAPQKRAFALAMIEGWITLTHKKPSYNNAKFVQFVENGWSDVSSIETDWTQAIKSEIKKLDHAAIWSLTESGPGWL